MCVRLSVYVSVCAHHKFELLHEEAIQITTGV